MLYAWTHGLHGGVFIDHTHGRVDCFSFLKTVYCDFNWLWSLGVQFTGHAVISIVIIINIALLW